jgi:hypothetical protein
MLREVRLFVTVKQGDNGQEEFVKHIQSSVLKTPCRGHPNHCIDAVKKSIIVLSVSFPTVCE